MTAGWRIGVDVGGTFTDLIVVRPDGAASVFKVPSVTANPAEGVLAGVRLAAETLGLSTGQLLGDCALFVHGSTIATNAVLERRDPPVALLTTAGFRDSIELRRGMRETPWRHRDPYPPVLAPRYLRLPVRGRLDSSGNEIEMLSEEDVVEAARILEAEAVGSVAICLLHSYANPVHEQRAAKILRRSWRGKWVSVSSEISPLSGEFERASTAVVNAYVAPRTVSYLRALDRTLRQIGLGRSLYLVQNNGGLVSVDRVAARPAALLLSGPAAGAGALAYYGRAIGSDNLISMEIGGTSCDVILVDRGRVAVNDHFQVAGYHLALPSIEVHTVGAGGGTIAGVDGAGMLFVGPRGAGAEPGPAAYGKGGAEPTVTDAQLVLGRLRPGPYASGSITLDLERASAAVEEKVARPLGLDVETAAAGIVDLVEQKLLGAVQRLSTERGYDTRDFVLVAAGGAGPLHGASVGRLLGCRRVYIPRLSGVFCALGMLHSDVRHDLVSLHRAPLDGKAPETLCPIFEALEIEARTLLAASGFQPHEMRLQREIDLHYLGQQWDTRVVLGDGALAEESLRAGFEREYERLYGHLQPEGGIEIAKLRVIAFGMLPPLSPASLAPAETRSPAACEHRRVFVGGRDGWAETPVYAGADLRPGNAVAGPLVIEEATTTLFAAPGDTVEIDAAGNFVIHVGAAPGTAQ
jgi:N-methylhydantoinase A